MRIQPFGDSALIVTFENTISNTINQKVTSLYHALEKKHGFTYQIPAYNSLTIGLDKSIWSFSEATIEISKTVEETTNTNPLSTANTYTIPICYDTPYDLDTKSVTAQTGLSKSAIIDIHTNTTFKVYMLGLSLIHI